MTDTDCDLLSISLKDAERLRQTALSDAVAARTVLPWRAASDPVRLVLLNALLDADELCVCDLAWIAGRADNLVSHHLRILRAEGLVDSRKDGKLAMYTITALGRTIADVVLADVRSDAR